MDSEGDGESSPLAPGDTTGSSELLTVDELIAQNGRPSSAEAQTEQEGTKISVAEILRQRKTAQRKKGGIDFSNTHSVSATVPPTSDALTAKEDPVEQLKTVVDRFAPQTGQVADVDKHM